MEETDLPGSKRSPANGARAVLGSQRVRIWAGPRVFNDTPLRLSLPLRAEDGSRSALDMLENGSGNLRLASAAPCYEMNAKPKLLVTGAHGFVAGSVLVQAQTDWEVHALSRGEAPAGIKDQCWHSGDALKLTFLEQLFKSVQPDAIIHTAAAADIDFCQANPGPARQVNVELTRTLATLCRSSGARLVFCSTDTIFDGEHAPYEENDPPGPVNVYAETKVEAEQIVHTLGARGAVARLALVAGLPLLGAGNSFLARLLASFQAGKCVGVPEHEVRTPVDVITAGQALLELARGQHHGIFHLAGLTRVNRLELNRTIARRFGFSLDLVFAQAAGTGRAPRPRDVSMNINKTRTELKTPMLTLEDGLSLIIENSHSGAANIHT